MRKMLYYPDFSVSDINFLKFALLYFDELKPIIPFGARDFMDNEMNMVIKYTDLIQPYAPEWEDAYNASKVASMCIEYYYNSLDTDDIQKRIKVRGLHAGSWSQRKDYVLFQDKYTADFEYYCLEQGFASRCNEGIRVNRELAYIYMSILADMISKNYGFDMITDNYSFSSPILLGENKKHIDTVNRIKRIRTELEFWIPVDLRKIPLIEFIRLRGDRKFEEARIHFVKELQTIIQSEEENSIDFYNLYECKDELYGLIKSIFKEVATSVVSMEYFKNRIIDGNTCLDFFAGANAVASLSTLMQQHKESKEYYEKFIGKQMNRRYLSKVRELSYKAYKSSKYEEL